MPIRESNRIPIPRATEVPTFEEALRSPQINITRFPQQNDAWCYAACARRVIEHCIPGVPVSQCNIAGFVKATTCCPLPPPKPQCTESGCSKPQIAQIFSKFNVNSLTVNDNIPFAKVVAEISSDPPRLIEAVIDWSDSPGTSHAVLIAGFIEGSQKIYIMDPLSPPSYGGWQSHGFVTSGFGQGNWDMTWIELKKKEEV